MFVFKDAPVEFFVLIIFQVKLKREKNQQKIQTSL
jgi:hypothetical protein